MAVLIGSARVDENGGYSGGKAGSQTEKEISTQNWYLHSKGWVLIRPKDSNIAEKIAKNMEYACDSAYVGYDQSQNTTLTSVAKQYGYDISRVKTPCETDCARLVRVCCLYAGIEVGDFYTGNMKSYLEKTGKFEILTSDKYCKSSNYLKRGDILVTKTKGHTVVVLSNGVNAKSENVVVQENKNNTTTEKPVVITNSTNKIDTVKEVQKWANKNYKSCLVEDGIYGNKTKKALVEIFQTELNQTYKATLKVDGIWGAKTRAACKTLKKGDKNDVVGVLQALLICNGYKEAYLDKDYGRATESAVILYQGKNGLVVDGKAGKNTFAKLCD